MKNRNALIISLLLMGVLGLIYLPFSKLITNPKVGQDARDSVSRSGTNRAEQPVSSGSNAASFEDKETSGVPAEEDSRKTFKQMSVTEKKEYLNHIPIAFYGYLEDQNSNRLPRTVVNFSVQYDTGFRSGIEKGQVVSDERGYFEIKGYKGEHLSVVPEKQGYVLWTTTNAGGTYSYLWPEEKRIKPDPDRPMVIRMWKLQGAEPLIHFLIETYVPRDGSPVLFDLQTGKRMDSGGDLIIRIESPSNPDVLQRYGWKATIQAVDGGLIPVNGLRLEFMFSAPESGYESEYAVVYQQGIKPWSSSFDSGFYLRSRGGNCYGKIGFGITTDIVRSNAIPVSLGGYLNPTGSRNLEIDPKLVTEVKTKGESN